MFRIKELREARGLNMREAARLLNMPYTTYVNYEKGFREPTSEVLIQLADFYETSVDYIVGRISSTDVLPFPVEQMPSKDATTATEQRNVIRLAGRDGSYEERSLSDEQLAMLKSLINQLPDTPEDL